MAINKREIYLHGVSVSFIGKFLEKISAFFVVWVINQVLTKGDYGNYVIAITIITFLSLIASGGLEKTVIYRLSRLKDNPGILSGYEYAGSALGWGLGLSSLILIIILFAAPQIGMIFANQDVSNWLIFLSILIPLQVCKNIYAAWHRSRQRIVESAVLNSILPSLGKIVLLFLVFLFWPSLHGILLAIIFAAMFPPLFGFIRTPLNPLKIRGQLVKWDFQYSAKLMFAGVLNRLVWNTDILLLGILTTSEVTAEYAVASRLALVLRIPLDILNSILMPRMGNFLSKNDEKSIKLEYNQTRILALIMSLLGVVVFVFGGHQILSVFGDYQSSYSILLILSVAYILHISFGINGGYLNIAGYGGWTLITTVLLLILNVLLNLVLIPVWGAEGAAFATLIVLLSVNILISIIVWQLDRFPTYSVGLAFLMLGYIAILMLGAINPQYSFEVGIVAVLLTFLFILKERKLIFTIINKIKKEVRYETR